MSTIPYSERLEHDQVARVSAETYLPVAQKDGLVVDINTYDQKARSVGGSNPIYPDVVVWKPNAPGSQSGTAVVVEAIETPTSLIQNKEDLQKLGSLKIPFTIIIPFSYKDIVKSYLVQNGIRYDRLQAYSYNQSKGIYEFININ